MSGAAQTGTVMAVDAIRSHFPALERTHDGKPVAYFDGPGGTQVPRAVVDRMNEYLYRHNANTHWNYPSSAETDAMLMDARRALADFVNGEPEEIAFGANMTTLTFHLARALGRGWREGDEVVVTELDHHANVAPWRALDRDFGVKVVTARMIPESGILDFENLEQRIGSRTRLLAIGAASNALGTVSDVRRAAALARAHGALVFVDAVHYAPHELVDVKALGADFLACSAYKFYGPHVGVLWGKRNLIEALDAPRLEPAPQESPERLETGTQNHEGIVGAGAAVDYLASLAVDNGEGEGEGEGDSRRARLIRAYEVLHERGMRLFKRLWDGVGSIPGVTRFGLPPDRPRTPTLALRVNGVSSDEAAGAFAAEGLFVSHGDFYATTVIERLGVGADGVVRIGCSVYTTEEEVDRAIAALTRIARGRGSRRSR